ncbi:MAG: GNAT family N-acetyltransferase [Ilumatobacteraceae bacterium]
MSLRIVHDHSDAALATAADIWAAATARRDGLAEPRPAVEKLHGLRSALGNHGAALHLAVRGDEHVGFVVLITTGHTTEVRYLAVTPTAWGDGVATRLLDHVARHADAAGSTVVELWVLDDNERAITVYLRAGWATTDNVKTQLDSRRTERRLERLLAERGPGSSTNDAMPRWRP